MTKSLRTLLVCAVAVLMVGCNSRRQAADKSELPTGKPQAPDIDIFTASGAGDLRAIRQHLASGIAIDVKEPAGGGTPLIVTAVAGQTAAAELLIENGASLSATNNDGATALHTAAFFGHPDMVRLLVDSGAEVNAKNMRGETPLDTVADEWTDDLQRLYQMVAVMFRLELDFERIKAARPVVAEMLRENK